VRMNRALPVERLDMTLNELLRRQPFEWHGDRLKAPDWSHESYTLADTVGSSATRCSCTSLPTRTRKRSNSSSQCSTGCRNDGGDVSILISIRPTISVAGPMRPCSRAGHARFSRVR
jgi:hypothetical protein